MRTSIIALAALALAACVGETARAQVPRTNVLTAADVARWSADLDVLAKEMPAQHANLFHAMSRPTFDSALAGLRLRLPTIARHQVIVELERLAARIGDGHSSVGPWRDTAIAFRTLPIALYRFADGYHVRAATGSAASLVGARVTRIGAVSIDSAERLVTPLINRDNAMGVWMYAPFLLVMPEVLNAVGIADDMERVPVTVERDGKTVAVTLAPFGRFPNFSGDADKQWNVAAGWVDARLRAPQPLWLSHTDATYWYEYLPALHALYCQINEIQERGEPLEHFLARAMATADSAGAQRFILDLRLNGGGNGAFNHTIVRALIRSRFDEPGRLFVITGRRTFSAAQMLISDLAAWTTPIFVGEPSASRGNHYGDSRRIVMPNSGVTMRVSSLWWQYWNPQDDRPWLAVDLAAPLTAAQYGAGVDPALDAIGKYTPSSSLRARLSAALAAGDTAALRSAAASYMAEPQHVWVEPRRALLDLATLLQREGQAAQAQLLVAVRNTFPMPRVTSSP